MDDPRADKVAVVDEVRERLGEARATILTEYRGLTVADLVALRSALAPLGGEYKIYKNTMVKLAIADGPHQPLADLLVGPTGITFVSGEVPAVAKALREYARGNPNLIVKGGMLGAGVLSPADLGTLADLPPRDVLLARMAGALSAPLQQLAGLLQALPRNLAYGIKALIDQQGGSPVAQTAPEAEPVAEAGIEPAAEAPADEVTETLSEAEPAAEAEAVAETEAPSEAEVVAEVEVAPAVETADSEPAEEVDG
jgi:large subunit ribosomal protein L10